MPMELLGTSGPTRGVGVGKAAGNKIAKGSTKPLWTEAAKGDRFSPAPAAKRKGALGEGADARKVVPPLEPKVERTARDRGANRGADK